MSQSLLGGMLRFRSGSEWSLVELDLERQSWALSEGDLAFARALAEELHCSDGSFSPRHVVAVIPNEGARAFTVCLCAFALSEGQTSIARHRF